MKAIVALIAVVLFAAVATTVLIYSPDNEESKEVEDVMSSAKLDSSESKQ